MKDHFEGHLLAQKKCKGLFLYICVTLQDPGSLLGRMCAETFISLCVFAGFSVSIQVCAECVCVSLALEASCSAVGSLHIWQHALARSGEGKQHKAMMRGMGEKEEEKRLKTKGGGRRLEKMKR